MWIALLIIAAIAVVLIIVFASPKSEPEAPSGNSTTITDDVEVSTGILDGRSRNVFIAGLSHHCSMNDVGYFIGVVFNEKDNSYDNRAMAIAKTGTSEEKIFGYVPSAVLDSYWDWCRGRDCVCVGYIYYDGEHLRGRIRAYLPSEEPSVITRDAKQYATVICEHFRWKIAENDFD